LPPKVGWLILGKLSVPDKAPFDVRDLARTLPKFPTHPTADQLYTDQKFEAYRALGQHIGNEAGVAAGRLRAAIQAEEEVEGAVQSATKTIQQEMSGVGPPEGDAATGSMLTLDAEGPSRIDVAIELLGTDDEPR